MDLRLPLFLICLAGLWTTTLFSVVMGYLKKEKDEDWIEKAFLVSIVVSGAFAVGTFVLSVLLFWRPRPRGRQGTVKVLGMLTLGAVPVFLCGYLYWAYILGGFGLTGSFVVGLSLCCDGERAGKEDLEMGEADFEIEEETEVINPFAGRQVML